jgi:arginine/serine-rich splicing factor 1/9
VERAPGTSEFRVIVEGLPKTASWQDLKDHFKKHCDVTRTDVDRQGKGLVEFRSSRDLDDGLALDGSIFANPFSESKITVRLPGGASKGRGRSRDSRDSRSRSRSRSGGRGRSRSRDKRRGRSDSRDRKPKARGRSRSRSSDSGRSRSRGKSPAAAKDEARPAGASPEKAAAEAE